MILIKWIQGIYLLPMWLVVLFSEAVLGDYKMTPSENYRLIQSFMGYVGAGFVWFIVIVFGALFFDLT